MQLIKKVSSTEVKKCFITTKFLKKYHVSDKNYSVPTISQYLSALKHAKSDINKLSIDKIDNIISSDYKKRLEIYNKVDWYLGKATIKELGEWKAAGGLPVSWTKDNLESTSKLVKKALISIKYFKHLTNRALNEIPIIMKFVDILKKEKYLYPIVLSAGLNPDIRKNLHHEDLEIDDGNMRSIAFALAGDKDIKLYIGL